MLTIDGSAGEGGGQIVRTSLALSALTGQAFTIHSIRAGRPRPGLRAQHLASVQAAARICEARVSGAEPGSRTLIFEPDRVRAGAYEFRVGTAGSTSLILQTVLPALITAPKPSSLVLEGGTHNPWAPPCEFVQRSFLPLLNRMGPHVSVHLQRHGFFPAGGGRVSVSVTPSNSLQGFELLERGAVHREAVTAIVARLPKHIGERELQTIRTKSSWPHDRFQLREVRDSAGPGNVVLIELESDAVTEVFSGFGRRGVRAEEVAAAAYRAARAYLEAGVPVGPHLADQLLLPLGISAFQSPARGGRFRTMPLTQHSLTHIDVLQTFLKIPIAVDEDRGAVEVRIGSDACTEHEAALH